jgi:hypothetical protein
MKAESSLIGGTTQVAARKVPVFGIAVGTAQTLKEGWNAKNAIARSLDTRRSKQERLEASRRAAVYGRRAIFKAGSTVLGQVPGYGTIVALTLDSTDAALRMVEGEQEKVEQKAAPDPARKRKSTEAFMRRMREQAAKEDLSKNARRQSIQQ